jgi:hypothetical protein
MGLKSNAKITYTAGSSYYTISGEYNAGDYVEYMGIKAKIMTVSE